MLAFPASGWKIASQFSRINKYPSSHPATTLMFSPNFSHINDRIQYPIAHVSMISKLLKSTVIITPDSPPIIKKGKSDERNAKQFWLLGICIIPPILLGVNFKWSNCILFSIMSPLLVLI